MIDKLGYYQTRDGRVVKITRIYDSQPIAEGFIKVDGLDIWYIWNCDGSTDRFAEKPRDITQYLWSEQQEAPDYD